MKTTGVALALLLTFAALSQGEPLDDEVNFAREVLPILSDKCFVCHGPDTQDDAELRLDSFDAATSDRGGYRAIDPETPADSELLARIHSTDDPMPPEDAEKQLTPAERATLTRWIQQGGSYAKHWSFVPPARPDTGATIDDFIHARLDAQGIDFAAEADRATLARRVALTLTGLPPEPDQLKHFLADQSPTAYDDFVELLLASPRFGEHQARYWLDAVRYGDTHGLHLDNRRGIYPYRDWVVRAFNQNLPLDKFITWQLAGDLLPDPTTEQLVATGFVRMNPTTGEGGAIPKEFQAKNNFDRTETFGTVMLGMSLTCARCHSHKYDPIPQTEYYGLMAFFNNTAESALDGNKYDYGPHLKVPQDQAGWDALSQLTVARDALFDKVQSAGCIPEDWNSLATEDRLKRLTMEGENIDESLRAEASELSAEFAALEEKFTTTLIAKELPSPRETFVLHRGEYDQPKGDPVQPNVLSVMGMLADDAPRNRLGLAMWLTSRDHPLVARVLINRIWQRVYGYGLVRTPEDFGLQGEQPTHPELLDWLAVELQESGWDMKHMLRLMVHSKAFKQSSAWRNDVDDPENRLFSRGPGYRLDAEVIRDLGLWASGLLDAHMGGEGVKPYQPAGMWKALAHPASNTKQYERDRGERLYRRSLYVYWKRTSPHPMMTLFDAPDRESSCVRRSRTNTSLQSLGLLNETQRLEMGRTFAGFLLNEVSSDEARLDTLFQRLACRQPNDRERTACMQLVNDMRQRYQESPDDASALLAQGEAPTATEIEAAELAAWTQLAITVLASDIGLSMY